jgi:hypothetical protein
VTERKCPICGFAAAHGIDYCLIHRFSGEHPSQDKPNFTDQSNMLSPHRSEEERQKATRAYLDAMSKSRFGLRG